MSRHVVCSIILIGAAYGGKMDNPNHTKIAICDDNPDIVEFLHALLSRAGYEPVGCDDRDSLFECLQTDKPALILLDIRLPDYDGFDIAETLRRHHDSVPIIFMTAHDNLFCRVYSPTVGAAGYFTKPLDTDALLQRIEKILGEQVPQPVACS